MKVVVITQARSGSTRLPNKILLKIKGRTLLQIHIDRIKKSKLISEIYIATTTNDSDDVIANLAKDFNVSCYRGSETDVLDRFYQTIKNDRPDLIVRLTSDCPLIDPKLLDEVIVVAQHKELDYYANILEERYPDGQDIEVFTFNALETAWLEAKLESEREHVTPYIRKNSTFFSESAKFTSANHSVRENYNHVRLTVDEQKDFEVIKILISKLGFDKNWKEYAEYYINNQEISSINSDITRNEGYIKSIKKD